MREHPISARHSHGAGLEAGQVGAGPRRALFTVISPGLRGAAVSRRGGNPLGVSP